MSEPVTDPAPAAEPAPAPAPAAKPSLEDSLAALDEQTRAFVLGEVKSAREEAKSLRGRLKEAEPIVQQWQALEEASKTELQRAQEEATRWQSEVETWRTRAVSSRVETLAADRFADPSDALAAINPADYLGSGGEIDEARINADLEAVLERKPHWRKSGEPQQPATPRTPLPNTAQGGSQHGGAPTDPATAFAAFLGGQLRK